MIAASAITPPVAYAVEQDHEREGTAPAAQAEGANGESPIAFDPGGGTTALPETAPSAPQAPVPAAEQPPVENAGAQPEPIVDDGDGSEAAPAQASPPAGPPPATEAAPAGATPPAATPVPAPAAEPATPASSEPAHTVASDEAEAPRRTDQREAADDEKQRRTDARVATPPTPQAEVVVAEPARVVSFSSGVHTGTPARPGDRSHTVRPGESLWAIASDLQGADATPSQIAREVDRIWQLNRDRIGTGNPNLLMVGTELTLR